MIMKIKRDSKRMLIEIATTPVIFVIFFIIVFYNLTRRIQELQL